GSQAPKSMGPNMKMDGSESQAMDSKVSSDSSAAIAYYTCPMPEHAYIHSDHPGDCPECGMKLVPVYTKNGNDK
ncbi:MAG: heavy metal-binding domain-containing protein, partial [Fidelibacterota bacterium]